MVSEINLTPTASYLDIGDIGSEENGAGKGAGGRAATAVKLPARTWGMPSECLAGAVLVHGLGAHSGWFEALGRRLKVRRIFSLAYDQVGFGKRRAQEFTSQQQWFDDLVTSYHHVQKMVGDKPVFVMGNSMGAAVSLKVVADNMISPAGLVMFSPGFDGHPDLFKLSYKIRSLFSAFASPEKEIQLPYTPEMITRSENVRSWLYGDPDRRFSPTGKMLLELLKLSRSIPKIRSVGCPVFMIRSGRDKIVDGRVSQRIFETLKSPSKKQFVYDEAWHDLMFDPVIDQLSDEVSAWIGANSPDSCKRS